MVASASRLETGRPTPDEPSLRRPAQNLTDAARAFRDASGAEQDPDDLGLAFALLDAALDDLAAAAERAAYSTMERSSRRGAGPPDVLPLATARAFSWRLHGLRARLVNARRICAEVTGVLDGGVGR